MISQSSEIVPLPFNAQPDLIGHPRNWDFTDGSRLLPGIVILGVESNDPFVVVLLYWLARCMIFPFLLSRMDAGINAAGIFSPSITSKTSPNHFRPKRTDANGTHFADQEVRRRMDEENGLSTTPNFRKVFDHRNGNAFDNRRGNFRRTTKAGDVENRELNRARKFGAKHYMGVVARAGNRYSVPGLDVEFTSAVDAAHARDEIVLQRGDPFPRLNFHSEGNCYRWGPLKVSRSGKELLPWLLNILENQKFELGLTLYTARRPNQTCDFLFGACRGLPALLATHWRGSVVVGDLIIRTDPTLVRPLLTRGSQWNVNRGASAGQMLAERLYGAITQEPFAKAA
jgi:hypothetical protein